MNTYIYIDNLLSQDAQPGTRLVREIQIELGAFTHQNYEMVSYISILLYFSSSINFNTGPIQETRVDTNHNYHGTQPSISSVPPVHWKSSEC